jgi:hypothetical protein
MDIANSWELDDVTPATACNLAACCLVAVTSLVVEAAWNYGAVTTAARYWWQPRLVSLVLLCALIQVGIRWWEGGYRRDEECARGFPVLPRDGNEN